MTELATYPGVDVVDLDRLGSLDFVDYCHPGLRGHRALAAAIAALIGPNSAEPDPGYVCVHPSPDALSATSATLSDYFGIEVDIDPDEVRRQCAELLARDLGDGQWPEPRSDLQGRILATLRHAARHPAITRLDDLRAVPPQYGWELGSLPELYLCRVLGPQIARAASECPGTRWDFTAEVYQRRISFPEPYATVPAPLADCRRILQKVRDGLRQQPSLFSDVRSERIATVRYCYTPEAFRYGTHSRPAMLYPRGGSRRWPKVSASAFWPPGSSGIRIPSAPPSPCSRH
ncbi:hypothetical protein ACIBKY_54540 [Nonomuraea sp. NPDC050394]|uniref:hypothetical protein n=1 Tax=Nonomuraea sp. NPDC050394 TaxID=3364363 RepID=UPI00379A38AB